MTLQTDLRLKILSERCVQLVLCSSGFLDYPAYDAPPDENERLVEVALRLSRRSPVQEIVDRAGFDKDLTKEERCRLDDETIHILDEMGWQEPYLYHLLASQALARRLCAGALAREAPYLYHLLASQALARGLCGGALAREDAAACLRFVSDRRCERYYERRNERLRGDQRLRPYLPPARLSDWLASLHYFQTREDLWRPFTRARDGESGKINDASNEKLVDPFRWALCSFASMEQRNHALFAWNLPCFSGLVDAYKQGRLDRFDDEAGIAVFLETNRRNLIDDRTETRP
jgi:hypothetical protein